MKRLLINLIAIAIIVVVDSDVRKSTFFPQLPFVSS